VSKIDLGFFPAFLIYLGPVPVTGVKGGQEQSVGCESQERRPLLQNRVEALISGGRFANRPLLSSEHIVV
jgi:hypothetical protein